MKLIFLTLTSAAIASPLVIPKQENHEALTEKFMQAEKMMNTLIENSNSLKNDEPADPTDPEDPNKQKQKSEVDIDIGEITYKLYNYMYGENQMHNYLNGNTEFRKNQDEVAAGLHKVPSVGANADDLHIVYEMKSWMAGNNTIDNYMNGNTERDSDSFFNREN